MRLVHRPADGDPRTLARTVERADSFLARARGLMFRRSIPDDYALAFRFARPRPRSVHMAFVAFPIDVVWLVDDEVRRVARLRPWIGFGRASADTIVELPAGAASAVERGDRVALKG